MITITDDQIQLIVQKLQAIGFLTCDRAKPEVVKQVVCKWLDEHIESLTTDPDWWMNNHGKDLRKYGLPYEDELELEASYQILCDRQLLEADHYDSAWV